MIWAMRIVGVLTMLVCLVSSISYPGTVPEFQLGCIVGGLLVLPELLCTMHLAWWVVIDLLMGGCSYLAIKHAPADLPGVSFQHLGIYPGVLIGIMALITTIFIGQVWSAVREQRNARNSIFDSFRGWR